MRISDWSSDVCSSDLERADAAVVVDEAVEMRAPCLCFLDRVAHHHEGSGQDLEMVGITPDREHAALHIRIEGLAALDRLLRAADHLGSFRRELERESDVKVMGCK